MCVWGVWVWVGSLPFGFPVFKQQNKFLFQVPIFFSKEWQWTFLSDVAPYAILFSISNIFFLPQASERTQKEKRLCTWAQSNLIIGVFINTKKQARGMLMFYNVMVMCVQIDFGKWDELL